MMAKKMQEADSEEEIKLAFQIFDRDGDKFLDRRELKMVRCCAEREIKEITLWEIQMSQSIVIGSFLYSRDVSIAGDEQPW